MSVNLNYISGVVADYLGDEPTHCQVGKKNRVFLTLCQAIGQEVPFPYNFYDQLIEVATHQSNESLIASSAPMKEMNKSYRSAMQSQVVVSARPVFERMTNRKPKALFFGPGELEMAPIKKLADQFDVVLVSDAVPFLKQLYKGIPIAAFKKIDLTGGLHEALAPTMMEMGMMMKQQHDTRICKKLAEAQKLMIQIDGTFATDADPEEVAFLGGAADFVVSYNVASQLGPKIINEFSQTYYQLAEIHERIPHDGDCIAKEKANMYNEATVALKQKCIVKHLNCLKACAQKEGPVLFADSFKNFTYGDKKVTALWSKDTLKQMETLFKTVQKSSLAWLFPRNHWEVGLYEWQPR